MLMQVSRSSESVDEFASSLRQRLQGLAASTTILIDQDWRGADLSELIHQQILPFADRADAIQLSGPPILLQPAAAETIGLALHELATNSVKYGALSSNEGHVEIEWDCAVNTDGEFLITWTEHGGPAVKEPTKRGFGSTVIERLVSGKTGGESKLEFREAGIRWQLLCPIDRIHADKAATLDKTDSYLRLKQNASK